MNTLNQHKDPRFYYIRVINLDLQKGSFRQDQALALKMQLGSKYSSTTVRACDFRRSGPSKVTESNIFQGEPSKIESTMKTGEKEFDLLRMLFQCQMGEKGKKSSIQEGRRSKMDDNLKRITEEAHIFKYGGEEFLNIFLEDKTEKEEANGRKNKPKNKNKGGNQSQKTKDIQDNGPNDNQNKNKKTKVKGKKGDENEEGDFSGYSRILLTPLIQHPHIQHTVNVQLIGIKTNGQVLKQTIAKLTLQIYFRLDFKGVVDIIPMEATLGQNLMSMGDMRPVLGMTLQGKQWFSLDAGGIHPHWSGYFHANRLNYYSQTASYSQITNLGNNIELSEHSLKERTSYHEENLMKKEDKEKLYFDIIRFPLESAGSRLEIKIYSKPFTKEESPLVGLAEFRVSNQGFLKFPTTDNDWGLFTSQQVDIFTKEEEPQFIGKLTLLVRFIFDRDKVLDNGPYKSSMGSSYVEELQLQQKANKTNVLNSRGFEIDNPKKQITEA